MKTILISFLFPLCLTTHSDGQERRAVTGFSDSGVEVTASCPESFPDNREVHIELEIKNNSTNVIRSVRSNGIEDITITLTGPNGEKIVGYHEMEGSRVSIWNLKRRFLDRIGPNENAHGDPVPLSMFWPLKTAGEYECTLTKRLYQMNLEDDAMENRLSTERGEPLEIKLPELRFRIEKIDETFVSPAAAFVSGLQENETAHPDEEPRASRYLILIFVAILGCGFIAYHIIMRGRIMNPKEKKQESDKQIF